MEGSQVWGNATLFDGATVETSSASSELLLRNGVKLQLGVESRAQIWQNRLVLEKGAAQLIKKGRKTEGKEKPSPPENPTVPPKSSP